MTDDIIRRLMLEHREHQTVYDDDRRRKALLREAADEIGRLRAQRDSLAHDLGRAMALSNRSVNCDTEKTQE